MCSSFLGRTLRPTVWALSPRGPPSRPSVPAHEAGSVLPRPLPAPALDGTPDLRENPKTEAEPILSAARFQSGPSLLALAPKAVPQIRAGRGNCLPSCSPQPCREPPSPAEVALETRAEVISLAVPGTSYVPSSTSWKESRLPPPEPWPRLEGPWEGRTNCLVLPPPWPDREGSPPPQTSTRRALLSGEGACMA